MTMMKIAIGIDLRLYDITESSRKPSHNTYQ